MIYTTFRLIFKKCMVLFAGLLQGKMAKSRKDKDLGA
jgi:hypothetical protein